MADTSASHPPTGGVPPTLTIAQADELLASTILTDDGRKDPYLAYSTLRAASPRWRTETGSVVLTEYQDCMEALRHPKLGRAEPDMDLPLTIAGNDRRVSENTSTMLLINPPDHTRIRGLVSRAFTPKRVEELRGTIEDLLDPVLDRFAARGGGDVMAELAVPYPVAVISELLGVPKDGNEHIQPLVRASTALIDPASDPETTAAGEAAIMELAAYFFDLVEKKRREPDDRLLSALIQVEEAGDRLSMEELISNTILLYAAGFETTSNLIGNGLRLLLEHPDQMELLRSDPTLIGPAIIEMLRADSPVQMNVRVVLEATKLFGEQHPRGSSFIVLQGSGNHDELMYAEGEQFQVDRYRRTDAPQPLSFGWGAHHCLGAHLARAEGDIVFRALRDRFPEIILDRDALDGQEPRFRASFTLRGLESLPVRVS
ncbi:cytochrome P450 [soil metagenome]